MTKSSVIFDIEDSINTLTGQKNILIEQRSQKSILSNKLKYECKHGEKTFDVFQQREDLMKEIASIDQAISSIKLEISRKHTLKSKLAIEGGVFDSKNEIINKLEKLKSKYQEFSTDQSRVSSMRLMATRFIKEIDEVINN